MKRTPLSARSAPLCRRTRLAWRPARSPVTPALRFTLWTRAQCACERCGKAVDLDGFDAHHRQRRREGDHGAANLLVVCRRCHREIEEERLVSVAAGWIVHSCDQPAERPVLLHDGRRVLLNRAGTYEEVA